MGNSRGLLLGDFLKGLKVLATGLELGDELLGDLEGLQLDGL